METLVCKICGSTDILEKDDCYICRYCGTEQYIKNNVAIVIANTTRGKQSINVRPINPWLYFDEEQLEFKIRDEAPEEIKEEYKRFLIKK